MMDIPTIERAFSRSKVLIFGNLQGNGFAMTKILDYAKQSGIKNIVTLGRFTDRDCMRKGMSEGDYVRFHQGLVNWATEDPERHWIGLFGKYDGWVPGALFMEKCMSLDGTKEKGLCAFQVGNLFFAHFDATLFDVFRAQLDAPETTRPSVFFFAHSYYMGINQGRGPEYPAGDVPGPLQIGSIERRRNEEPGFIHHPPHTLDHQLEPGKIYWVSTGGNFLRGELNEYRGNDQYVMHVVNFAVYDPTNNVLTLKSISEWQLHWRCPR
jgi:hypothetical protein